MKQSFQLEEINSKLENIKVRHELMLMEFPELIEMNKEFLKRKQQYKDSFNVLKQVEATTEMEHTARVSRPTDVQSHGHASNKKLLVSTNNLEKSPSRQSLSPHRHVDKPASVLAPPNKFYNVRLANYPVFLRRTSVKPAHFDNIPRDTIVTHVEEPRRSVVQGTVPSFKQTANAELQTISEESIERHTEPQFKHKQASRYAIPTQTDLNPRYKSENIQTSPALSIQSKSSKSSKNQNFKNLAQRHVVDWMVQQAFIKAMADPSDHSNSQNTTFQSSSSSESMFESYADNILKSALKELIYEQFIHINTHKHGKDVGVSPELDLSYTMASTDISLLKKSSSSSSKSKKVSFLSDKQEPIKTPLSELSIDPVPPGVSGDQLDSPSTSAQGSVTDLSMTETHGEMIPLGSVGEYLELPSFSQMLTNMKINVGDGNDSPPTFSSADLNITSSEGVSVGQILVTSSLNESGEEDLDTKASQGEIGIRYQPGSPRPSSFGSEDNQ